MAAGGGSGGSTWIYVLGTGAVLVAAAYGLEVTHSGPTWLRASLLAMGGLAVVFGSCESMIMCVEGIGKRLRWNSFVAGTMAGLASNIPELVMLGFVLAAEPRVGFIVVALTLHVGAMAFGIYSGLLPRDASGHAALPEPLVKLSTDLYAGAAAVFLGTGMLMVVMTTFDAGEHSGDALSIVDLYVLGAALLTVQTIAVLRLVKQFAGSDDGAPAPADAEPAPSVGAIIAYGLVGIGASILGGHAVGEFADILVEGLTAAGYSEMLGAILISIFACAGAFVMAATAHAKGLYDIALANVSGQITQVPFLVMPISLIMIAAFVQTGVVPPLPGGGALPIDLETTSVVILAFPPLLLLWKAVQDDGKVNWVETATMVAIFGLTIYFLAQHG